MTIKTAKSVKVSAFVLLTAITGMLPVTSMAHSNASYEADILLNLLPLISMQHEHHHDYGHHHPRQNHHRHHQPHRARHTHHHPGHRYVYEKKHHSRPVVRNHEGYSHNKIIRKHFQ